MNRYIQAICKKHGKVTFAYDHENGLDHCLVCEAEELSRGIR